MSTANRRPYCTHARLESDPDDGRGCPSCAVEARYPSVAYYGRAARVGRKVHAAARVFGPYLIVIVALVIVGLFTGAVERL
jgi:hypothetical protein